MHKAVDTLLRIVKISTGGVALHPHTHLLQAIGLTFAGGGDGDLQIRHAVDGGFGALVAVGIIVLLHFVELIVRHMDLQLDAAMEVEEGFIQRFLLGIRPGCDGFIRRGGGRAGGHSGCCRNGAPGTHYDNKE